MVCLSHPQEFPSICYDERDRHGLFTLPITFSMGSHYDSGQCRLARKGSRFLASFETYCQFTSNRIAPAFWVGSAQGSRVFSTSFPNWGTDQFMLLSWDSLALKHASNFCVACWPQGHSYSYPSCFISHKKNPQLWTFHLTSTTLQPCNL